MRIHLKKTTPFSLLVSLGLFMSILLGGLVPVTVYAGTAPNPDGVLSLSPNSGQYTVGSTLTVTITENSNSQSINAVSADLEYSPSILQYVSIDTSHSDFGTPAPNTISAGSVVINRATGFDDNGNPTTLTSSHTVASVSFKVIGTGSSAITFGASKSKIEHSDGTVNGTYSTWNGNTAGGSYSFVAPSTTTTTPPPTQTTTTTTTTPKSGSTGGSSGSTSSTSKTSSGTTKASSGSTSSPSSPSSSPASPVAAEGSTGNASTTTTTDSSGTTTLTPNFVAIKVVDSDGKAVSDATVVVDGGSQTVKTNSTGVASLLNLAPGKHTIKITYSGKTDTQTINVATPTSASQNLQQFDVKLTGSHNSGVWVTYVILLFVAAAVIWFVVIMPRRHRLLYDTPAGETPGIVTGDNHNQMGQVFMPGQGEDDPLKHINDPPSEPPKA